MACRPHLWTDPSARKHTTPHETFHSPHVLFHIELYHICSVMFLVGFWFLSLCLVFGSYKTEASASRLNIEPYPICSVIFLGFWFLSLSLVWTAQNGGQVNLIPRFYSDVLMFSQSLQFHQHPTGVHPNSLNRMNLLWYWTVTTVVDGGLRRHRKTHFFHAEDMYRM